MLHILFCSIVNLYIHKILVKRTILTNCEPLWTTGSTFLWTKKETYRDLNIRSREEENYQTSASIGLETWLPIKAKEVVRASLKNDCVHMDGWYCCMYLSDSLMHPPYVCLQKYPNKKSQLLWASLCADYRYAIRHGSESDVHYTANDDVAAFRDLSLTLRMLSI